MCIQHLLCFAHSNKAQHQKPSPSSIGSFASNSIAAQSSIACPHLIPFPCCSLSKRVCYVTAAAATTQNPCSITCARASYTPTHAHTYTHTHATATAALLAHTTPFHAPTRAPKHQENDTAPGEL
mmetsp:Transcript_12235/g.33391  ORF Transcript_12235/g.33391 Transcript_12235/m.33391 type:complete len:125 (-) Transcript_12235:4859-5233(-)